MQGVSPTVSSTLSNSRSVLSSCERDSTLSVQPCASPEAQLILAWYALSPTALLRQHLRRLKNSSEALIRRLCRPLRTVSVFPRSTRVFSRITLQPLGRRCANALRWPSGAAWLRPLFLRNFPFFFPKIYALHSQSLCYPCLQMKSIP